MYTFRDKTVEKILDIALIDSEQSNHSEITEYLKPHGMNTHVFHDGVDALPAIQRLAPDIVLVDPEHSRANGYALIRVLARQRQCGVIIISESSDAADRIAGLEVGADDYVCKPVCNPEFLARIHAVRRRMRDILPAAGPIRQPKLMRIGNITFDVAARAVRGPGSQLVPLTGAEFTVLQEMLNAGGQAISRALLCQSALRRPLRKDDHSIDKIIRGLRSKLAAVDDQTVIHSVPGGFYQVAARNIARPDTKDQPRGVQEGLLEPCMA
jgi:DNA-binding response OmpR family regulator